MKLKSSIKKVSLVSAYKYWRNFDEEKAEQLLLKINKILNKIKSL